MKALLQGALLMTMACTAVPPESANGEAPRDMSAGNCNAASLGDLVGRPASQDLGAEAMRRSGARVLRWIRPGDIVIGRRRSRGSGPASPR